MLHLGSDTPAGWARAVLPVFPELLVDHAHCEKKAASTALNLMFRYQDKPLLMRPMSALAREELEHFEQVLTLLEARGIALERQVPSPYAGELYKAVRRAEPGRLLDTLLLSSIIEARSCERMKLLAEVLPDPELVDFYRGLLACEARHFVTYVELAQALFDPEEVHARQGELVAHEAQVLLALPREARLHSRAPLLVA